jgi:hypothetical protein
MGPYKLTLGLIFEAGDEKTLPSAEITFESSSKLGVQMIESLLISSIGGAQRLEF